jgi:hypothetical protein
MFFSLCFEKKIKKKSLTGSHFVWRKNFKAFGAGRRKKKIPF